MNLLEHSHIIKMSGKADKDDIIITRIEAEKIIMLLSSSNKPQFIFIDGSLLNTSYIIGIVESPEAARKLNLYEEDKPRELTASEEAVHQKYLSHINGTKLLK